MHPPFKTCVLRNISTSRGIILNIGQTRKYPLHTFISRVTRITQPSEQHVLSLNQANVKLNILRIGENIDPSILNLYIGLVSEHGIIILDNSSRFKLNGNEPSKILHLGKFTTIFSDNQTLILRRDPIPQDIPFAIIMATYYRKSGNTKRYIERAMKSIANQTYQNYKVFLVGDKYEHSNEFNSFINLLPKGKITMTNLPNALERENCKIRRNLWTIGGANAMNKGIDLAVKQGYKYYVHLDDDDYWNCFHLQNMALGYKLFPETKFIMSRGISGKTIIPAITKGLDYNNIRDPTIFHSAFGFRLDVFSFRYQTLNLSQPERLFKAADWVLREQLYNECIKKNYKYLAIPMITCFHPINH